MLSVIFSAVCLVWYSVVLVVCAIGYSQLYRYYRSRPLRAVSESLNPQSIPHVTVIRPVKGIEPLLYECLVSTFQQSYPRDKLSIFLCVSSRDDPAVPILEQVVNEFAHFDAKVLVEAEDVLLNSASSVNFGPNPKIRNMSRAYREAKGDIVWIVDCNVWVGKGAAGRMVDTLCGFGNGKKHKFVHQLPVVVDVTDEPCSGVHHLNYQAASTSTSAYDTLSRQQISEQGLVSRVGQLGGTRLEELFMSSSHAKFYTAINTVLIAPCIVGKSNMFRRSHLDSLTSRVADGRPCGIDFFSHNICEDHLIGDLLWKNAVPEEAAPGGERLGKHALCFGDLAIQPMAGMGVREYAARRVRWLRVRKFTVLSATLVEPGTESFLCSLMGAYGATTLPWVHAMFGLPQTWAAFAAFWLVSVLLWAAVDRSLFLFLQAMGSVEADENTPDFARGRRRKRFGQWLVAWLGRETLAFPIWFWAVCGGVTVVWRGKKFRVSIDARVRPFDDGITAEGESARLQPRALNGHAKSRLRLD